MTATTTAPTTPNIAWRHVDRGTLLCHSCHRETVAASDFGFRFFYDAARVAPQSGDFCVSCCANLG